MGLVYELSGGMPMWPVLSLGAQYLAAVIFGKNLARRSNHEVRGQMEYCVGQICLSDSGRGCGS